MDLQGRDHRHPDEARARPRLREGLGQVGRERRLVIDVDEDVWDPVQAVNVKGIFLCSQVVARSVIERDRGGRIINISSLAGQRWVARFAAYCTSKFAVRGLYTVRPVASTQLEP